jgi:hypothetical protein
VKDGDGRAVSALVVALLFLTSGCIGGEQVTDPLKSAPKTLTVTTSAFSNGAAIPREYTCQGSNVSPDLAIANLPNGTKSVALIMDDPDAPRGTFLHWTFWNLPPEKAMLAKGAKLASLGAREGENDGGRTGYAGPCPPSGSHRYFFKAYALSEPLELAAGAELSQLTKTMESRVLAWGELLGTYQKS